MSKEAVYKYHYQEQFNYDDILDLLNAAENSLDTISLKAIEHFFDAPKNNLETMKRFFYLKARFSLIKANANIHIGNHKEALIYLNDLKKIASEAVKIEPYFSDAYRVLGEGLGRIISINGAMSGALYGKRSYDSLVKSIELDQNNSPAYCALGIWKLKTPKLWGGNLDEAICFLNKSTDLDSSNAIAYGWLGIALFECKRTEEALVAFRNALRLQPKHPWIIREFELRHIE